MNFFPLLSHLNYDWEGEEGCPLKNNELGMSHSCSLLATGNCPVLPGIAARRPAAAFFLFFFAFVCDYDSQFKYN
jgi:hypothetical protein